MAKTPLVKSQAEAGLKQIIAGEVSTPFAILGIHPTDGTAGTEAPGRIVRVFLPWANSVAVVPEDGPAVPMRRDHPEGFFTVEFPNENRFFGYHLVAEGPDGSVTLEDPYRFSPALPDEALERLTRADGRTHEILGAHSITHEGVEGVRFAVWAPGVRRVSVVGDFNSWDPRIHPMRPRGASGIWELFLPGVAVGSVYKFAMLSPTGVRVLKADPYARAAELRPATGSRIAAPQTLEWTDQDWLAERPSRQSSDSPISIYEVHLPSWRRQPDSNPRKGVPGWLNYRELAEELLPYVRDLGFTHVELLPVTEHPLDGSWGYQTTGYFAPSARQGTPEDFRYFVDRAHSLGIGVILDWVPAHFGSDRHGLAKFVGAPLYEYPDPRRGMHPDWGTLIFDYGRPEVRAFLISSALFWIEECHIDGLRIDAVASMLYLDYSRDDGMWVPNVHGGKEHLEAVDFIRELNATVHEAQPGVLMIAEESTAWPRVTHPLAETGLGFDLKWNMGWMHDTLEAFTADPVMRPGLYERLTFSIMYAFSERFLLALSHDEVVHLKRSLLQKMPGSIEQKFANLRLLYGAMWTHPGKKLLFMGSEFAAWWEWDFEGELDWALLDSPMHAGTRAWVSKLNAVYAAEPALHATDGERAGFEWVDCHDRDRTVLAYLRWSPEWKESVVVVANLAGVPWSGYRLAVPAAGEYSVLLDSNASEFGGGGSVLPAVLTTTAGELHGREQWIEFDLPALSLIAIKRVESAGE